MIGFHTFLVARTVSHLGTSMSTVALAFGVLGASGRPSDLGIVLAASFGPHLALLLVGGAVADRFSRRTVLVVANLVAGLAQAGVAAVLLTGRYSLLVVSALALVNGVAESFASPALRGIVPDLVPPADLHRANSLLASARHAARIVGPAAAGVVAAVANGGWAIAVDALSFLVAAALLTRLPARRSPAGGSLLPDLRDGWHEFRSRRWVWTAALWFSLFNLANVGAWQVLGPALTGPVAWGVVLSVRAVGLLAMSLVLYRLAPRRPLRTGALAAATGALPLLALGTGAPVPALVACAFLSALGFATWGVLWDTALQRHVPAGVLSRVASYDDLLSFAAIPLSLLLVGPAAAVWGAGPVTLVCGVVCAVSAVAPLTVREFRDFPARTAVAVDR
ncbi:MFS transporter [Umezawaea sp.]|uniref:MFS transporter n=1 Tax=Umezawaea sp. TaxID=1955258 RepID=UPI002ED25716